MKETYVEQVSNNLSEFLNGDLGSSIDGGEDHAGGLVNKLVHIGNGTVENVLDVVNDRGENVRRGVCGGNEGCGCGLEGLYSDTGRPDLLSCWTMGATEVVVCWMIEATPTASRGMTVDLERGAAKAERALRARVEKVAKVLKESILKRM